MQSEFLPLLLNLAGSYDLSEQLSTKEDIPQIQLDMDKTLTNEVTSSDTTMYMYM